MTEHDWHPMTVAETFATLESGPGGLSFEEAEQRREQYGPNAIEEGERTSPLKIFLAQLKNPLLLVLVAAAGLSLLAGKKLDAVVVVVIIALNSIIGFIQEYRAEEALAALKSRTAPEAEVVRECPEEGGCIEVRIPTADIVPGDVILLDAGAKVPADLRLIETVSLDIDESMLTGESLTVRKHVDPLPTDLPLAERTNLAYGGTIVTHGRGRGVVYATGAGTEIGKIATLIQETEKVESPLHAQVGALSRTLGLLAFGVAMLTVVIGLLRGFPLQEILLFALASAVSSIPEGLPAVLTITLAVGVSRMAQRNAIIRRLHAVDTLGAATAICSDKTGTLTTNQMTLRRMLLPRHEVDVTGVGYEPHGRFVRDGRVVDPTAHDEMRLALHIGALCNDARLVHHFHDGQQAWEIRGDPTEGALVVAAAKAGQHKETLERRYHRIDEIPFSSQAKYMVTFHETPEGGVSVYVKGAPETLAHLAARIRQDGKELPMDAAWEAEVHEAAEGLATQGLRVLGLAYAHIDREDVAAFKARLEAGERLLTYVALVGVMDPPRAEVPEAVARSKHAGIRVLMATGDHRLTAERIARDVGILDTGTVLTGAALEVLEDAELDAAMEDAQVFARVSPEHKHRIVESLRRRGHVVAMTGDGVNDAPALKAAEIGVAMGIAGTDVTKETAEMVLTDDNFASIVNAVEEGRVVFQNVRKVVKFLLSTNVGEDLTLLTALAFLPGHPLILSPVQILWINLVTDGVLDITLALEPQEGGVMEESPRPRTARIINAEILRNVVFVALFMAAGTLAVFVQAHAGKGIVPARTMAFTTMAMFQVFNALNCRSRDKSLFRLGLFSNRYLLLAMVVSVLLQVGTTLLPFMQRAFGTTALSLQEWGIVVLVSSTVFVADELRKRFTQRK
jgi:Ca2+-transporting ATPase